MRVPLSGLAVNASASVLAVKHSPKTVIHLCADTHPADVAAKLDEKVSKIIDEHGWSVTFVDDAPPFGYSAGMLKTLGHPEVIIFGVHPHHGARIINSIGEAARSGSPLPVNQPVHQIIHGYPAFLKPASPAACMKYMTIALRHYEGDDFQALQCFWPDPEGRFPWDPGYSVRPEIQPDLSRYTLAN